ncbi:nicotinate (nicotinamide) nucleotide adenylyltransferase [Psychrosphaera aestuarii]|uniref:nicotinate (nicotinamide) nucleotide adenylyltransferase n=1 Tax=Psychrosphaera aestuarii TaxID=1266052 RepID=UPI001B3384F9|nr:nicotinate (nicotinamide) nucleotide adenylyltransferase [Psychrosphaera aestuarii]
MNNKPLVVLYGGTFNPIHFGHLKPVASLSKFFDIKELIYIPCHIPPHKDKPALSAFHRLEMTKLAVREFSFAFSTGVSDYELNRSEASYSLTTIDYFIDKYVHEELAFLVGLDSLLNFTSWFKWQEILKKVHLIVMTRPGYQIETASLAPELQGQLGKRIHLVETDNVDISSTEIRKSFSTKLNDFSASPELNDLLPSSIIEYIKKHELCF